MFLNIKMQASVSMVLVGIILVCTIGFVLIANLITLFNSGGSEFLRAGFIHMEELLGSNLAVIFISFAVLVILIMFFRFLISWIGEDSGGSANN